MNVVKILLVSLCLVLGACASVVRNPIPEADHMNATVLGDVTIRNWGDGVDLHSKPREVTPQVREEQFGGIMHREHNYLVISGGGAKGAYGAGVLNAWSELGTRPEFTVVTGISTGALTAPFAFLGSDYDAALKEIYTTLDTRRIIDTRNIFAIIGGDSISDSSPLKRLIEELIDEEMVAGIAREYHRGRQLLVGTTHLDAGRPMVWNITRMAASEHPDAINLIRQVLLASASIPGAFPPVYIEVETPDGRKYDEMHVDGGTSSQMFFYPASINWGDVTDVLDVRGTPTIYIIRNAFIQPKFKTTQPRLLPIANRTISSLIRTQGIGDFYKIATLAGRDGLDLEVTWIPDEANEIVRVKPSEDFDPDYMSALFEYGYKRTLEDETWLNYYEWIKKY
jgi:predicted acylesterase/phospholipase RssA